MTNALDSDCTERRTRRVSGANYAVPYVIPRMQVVGTATWFLLFDEQMHPLTRASNLCLQTSRPQVRVSGIGRGISSDGKFMLTTLRIQRAAVNSLVWRFSKQHACSESFHLWRKKRKPPSSLKYPLLITTLYTCKGDHTPVNVFMHIGYQWELFWFAHCVVSEFVRVGGQKEEKKRRKRPFVPHMQHR